MRPTVIETNLYYSTGKACRLLNLGRKSLVKRLASGVLPPPTLVNEAGLRFFDERWLNAAKLLLMADRAVISKEQLISGLGELHYGYGANGNIVDFLERPDHPGNKSDPETHHRSNLWG